MWIFLSIVAFIIVLITAILLLPVYIIIKNDEDNNLILICKFLFKTFGEKPNSDSRAVRAIKERSGVSKAVKKNLEKSIEDKGFLSTVTDSAHLLMNLLKEIAVLLKHCTAKKFHIQVVCAEDNAADTAVNYGKCCSAVYPVAAFLNTVMKVKKRGQNIDIHPDFTNGKPEFHYDILISVRVYSILAALFKVVFKEALRTMKNKSSDRQEKS